MPVNSNIAILAGGKSERMGVPKGLLVFKKTFWLLQQLNQCKECTIYIGLGFDYSVYFKTIPWLEAAIGNYFLYKGNRIKVVVNNNPSLGFFSTIQHTFKEIFSDGLTAQDFFLLLIDNPIIEEGTFIAMKESNSLITIPTYFGKKGHPIKMSPSFWNRLIDLPIDNRLDYLINEVSSVEIHLIPTSDKNCIRNLNTPEDWRAFLNES